MNTQTKNIILIIVRIIVGGMLAFAGYTKLIDMDSYISMFNKGFGLSAGITWAVAIGEFLAGLGLVFGVWTKVAGLGAAIIMAGAVYYTGGDIKAVIFFIGSLILIVTGSGRYAMIPCGSLMSCCSKKDVKTCPVETAPTTEVK